MCPIEIVKIRWFVVSLQKFILRSVAASGGRAMAVLARRNRSSVVDRPRYSTSKIFLFCFFFSSVGCVGYFDRVAFSKAGNFGTQIEPRCCDDISTPFDIDIDRQGCCCYHSGRTCRISRRCASCCTSRSLRFAGFVFCLSFGCVFRFGIVSQTQTVA